MELRTERHKLGKKKKEKKDEQHVPYIASFFGFSFS
jgi:hypothetical protein